MGAACCGDPTDNSVQRDLNRDKRVASKNHKLLLLGPGSSGKSTFFKQLCTIHGGGFQDEDLRLARQNINDCVIDQMKQLTERNAELREDNEDDETYALDGKAKEAAERMLSSAIPRGGIDITPEIAELITTLWAHPAIKNTFATRKHLGVVDSAPHFFEDIDRIAANDYVPTNEDILLVRIQTTGIRQAKFEVENNHFTVVDVGGQRNERKKWIDQFSIVDAVLFVSSLSCYDQNLYEEDDVNAMGESIRLFGLVLNMRYFRQTSMILFLNKADLFEEKIKHKSIRLCFGDEYQGEDGDAKAALEFITTYFLKMNEIPDRQIYTHVTTATNSENVKKVFHDVQHAVVVKALGRNGIM